MIKPSDIKEISDYLKSLGFIYKIVYNCLRWYLPNSGNSVNNYVIEFKIIKNNMIYSHMNNINYSQELIYTVGCYCRDITSVNELKKYSRQLMNRYNGYKIREKVRIIKNKKKMIEQDFEVQIET